MSKKIDRNKQHTRSKCWIRKLSELTFNLDCNFYNWLINYLECWKDNILCKQSLASYLIREIINLKYCCWESSHICKGKDRNRDTNAVYWSARKEAFFYGFNMVRKAINFHYVKFAFSFLWIWVTSMKMYAFVILFYIFEIKLMDFWGSSIMKILFFLAIERNTNESMNYIHKEFCSAKYIRLQ